MTALASSGANNQYFQVTFQGALAGLPQPPMTISTSGLTASREHRAGQRLDDDDRGGAGLTINTGGTVTLDNTAINNTNRINDAATVALNGGTLNFLGTATAASSQTLGALPDRRRLTVNSTSSGQNATLTFASLARSAGATVNFVARRTGRPRRRRQPDRFQHRPGSTTVTNGNIRATSRSAAAGGTSIWPRLPSQQRRAIRGLHVARHQRLDLQQRRAR